jgi:transposase
MFVGIDWASTEHAVCVLDQTGKTIRAFRIPHSAAGFDDLVARLRRLGRTGRAARGARTPRRPAGRPAAGSRPSGGPGPLQRHQGLARGRGRLGRQVRRRDAKVIAEYLRLRHHQLRTLTPFSDATRALRTVVRARGELVRQRVAAINQLIATLDAFWPGAKAVFPDIEREIALAFLERYPTPESAAGLGERRMAPS